MINIMSCIVCKAPKLGPKGSLLSCKKRFFQYDILEIIYYTINVFDEGSSPFRGSTASN